MGAQVLRESALVCELFGAVGAGQVAWTRVDAHVNAQQFGGGVGAIALSASFGFFRVSGFFFFSIG